MYVLEAAAALVWATGFVGRTGARLAVFLHPVVRRRAAVRSDRPPVSVVVPVVRMEPGVAEAFDSLLSQTYGDFEVLVTAAEPDSDVLREARESTKRFPGVPVRFLTGNVGASFNPKMDNVAPALAAAWHDLVLIKDVNVLLADGQLEEMVRNLTPGTGMVCAIPVGVQAATFAAEVGCAITNVHQDPGVLTASLLGINIGFGKAMLFDRRELARVNGLAAMRSTLGDDHVLAKAFARIGLRTVFVGRPVRQVIGRATLREVWDRQLRWMWIRRRESLPAFLLEPFFTAGPITLVAALAGPAFGVPGRTFAAATFAAWLASDCVLVALRGWGWSWRFPAAAMARELMLVALWLWTWRVKRVTWAGRPIEVGGRQASVA